MKSGEKKRKKDSDPDDGVINVKLGNLQSQKFLTHSKNFRSAEVRMNEGRKCWYVQAGNRSRIVHTHTHTQLNVVLAPLLSSVQHRGLMGGKSLHDDLYIHHTPPFPLWIVFIPNVTPSICVHGALNEFMHI